MHSNLLTYEKPSIFDIVIQRDYSVVMESDAVQNIKMQAAQAGMSVSDYLLSWDARRVAGQPTMEEFLKRLGTRPNAYLSESPAQVIRRMRDGA